MADIIQQNEHLSFGLGAVAAFRIDGSKETHTQAPIKAPAGKIAFGAMTTCIPSDLWKSLK